LSSPVRVKCARLWLAIRGGALGVWFRRQVPLGRFIGDFVAASARLIVEVDGGYHTRRRAADARRERALQRLGYRVLRLDAELVNQQLSEAVAQICAALRAPLTPCSPVQSTGMASRMGRVETSGSLPPGINTNPAPSSSATNSRIFLGISRLRRRGQLRRTATSDQRVGE